MNCYKQLRTTYTSIDRNVKRRVNHYVQEEKKCVPQTLPA